MKYVILGGGGWVAGVLARELSNATLVSRSQLDYTQYDRLNELLNNEGGSVFTLINAAGVTGVPNVDACERNKNDCALGNAAFPVMVATLCASRKVPWVYIGSGCIYSGFKVCRDGSTILARRYEQAGMYNSVVGYNEEDEPNFTFDDRSSFYSATKAVADRQLRKIPGGWNLRIRMPFDKVEHPKNLITKLLCYDRLYDDSNSMTCLPDLANLIEELAWDTPHGTYNSVNSSWASTRDVVKIMKASGLPVIDPKWFADRGEFLRTVSTPRSNCILSTAKLGECDLELRHVESALVDCCRSMA